MGVGGSSKKESQNAETYYQNLSKTNMMNEGSSKRERVQLSLVIKPAESMVDYSVCAHLGESPQDYKLIGITEETVASVYSNDYVAAFKMSFILDYYFEKQQYLLFKVKRGNIVYDLEVTLGSVMGSKGQILEKPFFEGCIQQLVIIGNTLKNNNINVSITFAALHTVKLPVNIFYIIKKENKKGNHSFFQNVYKSEFKLMNNKKYTPFNNVKIPSDILCNGEFSTPLQIEFHDSTNQVKIGSVTVTVDKLCSDENALVIPDKKNNGALNIQCKCKQFKEYTFLNYLRGGMQLALAIGIDYTQSNGNPKLANSLHHLDKKTKNSYEKAIQSCGDIVAYYDYDQLFPCYGFGAILPNSKTPSMCFNLDFEENPNIHLIDNVLYSYKSAINKITLSGPTLFAPLINKQIEDVKNEKNTMIYHLLLILTSGIIEDMDDTIDAIVEASYLPISIIIVGIGDADFTNMNVLDSDDKEMFDKNKRKAARDIVQFVPFHKFENDGEKLAEEVLEEVPRQVVDHYRIKKIKPNGPIVKK